jgi:citrate synthase
MALSFVAQSVRGAGRPPVPQREVDMASSIPERFLIRWRGEADPDHVKAIDAYWISAAEHGMTPRRSPPAWSPPPAPAWPPR